MLNQIESCIYNLKLIKHNYRIIHVRIHDDCFYENNTTIKNKNKYVINIINHINAIKQHTNDDILLIASNNKIKCDGYKIIITDYNDCIIDKTLQYNILYDDFLNLLNRIE